MLIRLEASAFLLLLIAAPVHLQDECVGNSCYPNLGDLMVGRATQLSASSTCGLYRPQNYCILGYLENERKCFTCDSRRPYNLHNNPNSHRIENIITTFQPQRMMSWWQSENGVHEVSIQLDLETIFQFSHLILTFKSFRPAAMLVERSKDFGQTWKVFRYFAEDCANSFPGIAEGPADSIDELICDSRYSGAEPSTNGEVVLKALDPSYDIHDPYDPTIQELITLTNLRVNFTRLLTLGDTLLTRRRRNPQDKYFYAIYEMVVRGSCFCNGHASQCIPVDSTRGDTFREPGMVHGRCVCQHNTAGYNCEHCQDFYHDAPWRPGGKTDSDVCRRCNCNGHSEKCHFDLARYLATGGVSGGVCDDCRNNRIGPQCELCKPYYYQDPQRNVEDPNACIPCDCDPDGSVDQGFCDPVTSQCLCKQNVEGEHCDRCKFGFYGLSRDDPSGCQICRCNFMGTMHTGSPCDQTTGRCICEHFAYGPQCDQCLPGYWGLGNTVYGCIPCDCDIGGALRTLCSSENGQCECRPNMVGLGCSEPAPGYFLAPLDFYIYEAENAVPLVAISPYIQVPPLVYPPEHKAERPTKLPLCPLAPKPSPTPYNTADPPTVKPAPTPYNTHVSLPICEHYFRQRGYDFKLSNGRIVVVKREKRQIRRRRQGQRTIFFEPDPSLQIVPRKRTPDGSVTWTGLGFVRVQDGTGLRFTVADIPSTLDYYIAVRYEPESTDDWAAIVNVLSFGSGDGRCPNDPSDKMFTLPGSGRVATLNSPVCLSYGDQYHVEVTFRKQPNADPQSSSYILIDSVGLIPKVDSLPNFCSKSTLTQFQQYRCVELGAQVGEDTLPEVCEKLIGSISAIIHNGAVSCNCHCVGAYGSSCSKFTGQCECKPNVIGRCCDSCAPLSYGLGPNGCSPCDCNPSGSTAELCDQRTGQCLCRDGVTGRRCDKCYPGYYGFPLCRLCQCNRLADICDPVTGVCLDCREHSTGHSCERCKDGYVGDPVSGQPCEPCLCPDLKESGRFFAITCNKDPNSVAPYCECLPGHKGPLCDTCATGYFGDLRLPGVRCEECYCNNNIDPRDGDACNAVTGECLRCLHNTEGARCQSCKPGYYGNALAQDCKECSCDQRGTEVTKCPAGSPCFCDQETGQCPCRTGVKGALCNECEDGYWNLNGESGCEPCNCDPEHAFSYTCDKTTGQCFCQPEYGGRQCDECGPNHFGNPDIQCIYCDCNMKGTIHPACDPYTGECLCRPGVTGLFCDECAPSHDTNFPTCEPCHACYQLWGKSISDVTLDAERIKTMMPCPEDFRPRSELEVLEILLEKLQSLLNITSKDEMEKLEELLARIRNETETLDPNIIIIDPTTLINTDIDNIRHEFNKVLKNLREKTKEVPVTDMKALNDTLNNIKKLYGEFTENEKKVEAAKKVLEASRKTRENVTLELAKCRTGMMDKLEKKVKALGVTKLNEEICGTPGEVECEKAKCGGASCGKCGGPGCTGSLPISLNATKLAEMTEKNITDLRSKLREADAKLVNTTEMTDYIKDQAEDLMNKINQTKNKSEKEKNDTKNLIEKVKNYLRDELVKPEDIEKLANAVLSIQLPKSPNEMRNMIEDIKNILSNFTDVNEDLENLEKHAKIAEIMKEKAKEILNRTKEIDMRELEKVLNDTAELHDKIINDLVKAEENNDDIRGKINKTKPKLKNIEENLMSTRAKVLLDEITALKNKTEMNRSQGKEAKAVADAALTSANDTNKDLEELKDQFEKFKSGNKNKSVNEEANEHLKNITSEAENLAKDVEDKMKQIEDLEKRILDAIQRKDEKMKDLEALQEEANYLRDFIVDKVDKFSLCST
ncbi:laminin subunit beta-4 isoform X1 [Myxocyprinus asiaticus]|uniref:laminin subunit beta-4 isoform X1 n=1 Tax=Myxocyprinus asiaticus TaxID=70543 RepID=UPI002221330D|nr:laminin subunit beta-4 isoform X1 [Myxocyprinus asiaticus]